MKIKRLLFTLVLTIGYINLYSQISLVEKLDTTKIRGTVFKTQYIKFKELFDLQRNLPQKEKDSSYLVAWNQFLLHFVEYYKRYQWRESSKENIDSFTKSGEELFLKTRFDYIEQNVEVTLYKMLYKVAISKEISSEVTNLKALLNTDPIPEW